LIRARRSKAQASRDKRALQKLRSTGLYTGKIDLRKAPTRYQKSLMGRFADVLAGKAAVVRPADPKAYKRAGFRTAGKAVIVPKRKGERIGVGKTGRITRTRKGAKRATIIPVRGAPVAEGPVPGEPAAQIYYLPFKAGTGPGAPVEYRRFSRRGLVKFFLEYKRDNKHVNTWLRSLEVENASPALERELDVYLSGELAAPRAPIDRDTKEYRRAKRRLKRDIADEDEE
jgi:hypothetical protein